MAPVERMRVSSRAATWARASPALGSRGLSLAGKSDSTRYTVASEGFARPCFVRIWSCASNRRRLSSPRRCRLARFLSALFEVGAGDSDSDAESAMGRVAICAGSRGKEGLRSGVVSIAVRGKNAVGPRFGPGLAQIWPRPSPRQKAAPAVSLKLPGLSARGNELRTWRNAASQKAEVGENAASGRPPRDSVRCIAQNCQVFRHGATSSGCRVRRISRAAASPPCDGRSRGRAVARPRRGWAGACRRVAQNCQIFRHGATSSGRGEGAHTAAARAGRGEPGGVGGAHEEIEIVGVQPASAQGREAAREGALRCARIAGADSC